MRRRLAKVPHIFRSRAPRSQIDTRRTHACRTSNPALRQEGVAQGAARERGPSGDGDLLGARPVQRRELQQAGGAGSAAVRVDGDGPAAASGLDLAPRVVVVAAAIASVAPAQVCVRAFKAARPACARAVEEARTLLFAPRPALTTRALLREQ